MRTKITLILSSLPNIKDLISKEVSYINSFYGLNLSDVNDINIEKGLYKIDVLNIKEAILYTYLSKSVGRVSILLDSVEFKGNIKELITNYNEFLNDLFSDKISNELNREILDLINSYDNYSVRLTNRSNITKIKQMFESEIGKVLVNNNKNINLENPDIILRFFLEDNFAHITLDLVGEKDLSKRAYKIYNNPHSLNPVTAHNLVLFSNWEENNILLDPFSYAGVIVIEAAWKAMNIPGSYLRNDLLSFKYIDDLDLIEKINNKIEWDKELEIYSLSKNMAEVEISRKNARIAKVEDKINFSRVDLEWLDWKFEEGYIDNTICRLENNEKVIKEFFYQEEYVGNKIDLISEANIDLLRNFAKQYRFKLERFRDLNRKDNLNMFKFGFDKNMKKRK